ncbi:hypothetical protein AG1IA_00565 [Rhizoctonia solani AG-1 IA]|uniref:Uncharacterized protein n=1 Tax=Thanatephorus cucumeris (strain AG1-IA) TaxID=983506 RepID=L8X5E1_THACA|nr:hypothetical protein AG1IA_00565 [Rhizoctonia solani AG-1 IA]
MLIEPRRRSLWRSGAPPINSDRWRREAYPWSHEDIGHFRRLIKWRAEEEKHQNRRFEVTCCATAPTPGSEPFSAMSMAQREASGVGYIT